MKKIPASGQSLFIPVPSTKEDDDFIMIPVSSVRRIEKGGFEGVNSRYVVVTIEDEDEEIYNYCFDNPRHKALLWLALKTLFAGQFEEFFASLFQDDF